MVMLRWIIIALMRKTFKNKVNSLRTNKLVFALKITKRRCSRLCVIILTLERWIIERLKRMLLGKPIESRLIWSIQSYIC